VAHLLVNGNVGGINLFGSVLAWAVSNTAAIRGGGPSIPQSGLKNDIAAVVVGIVLYLALGFVFHPVVVGRPVFSIPGFGT
jgi:hypothetical protein